jgi:hypothetical protein
MFSLRSNCLASGGTCGQPRSPLGICRGCFTAFGLHPRQCRERTHPSRRQGSASPRSSPVRCSPGSAWLRSAAASGLALDPFQAANSLPLVLCVTYPKEWLNPPPGGLGGVPPSEPRRGVAEARSAGRDTPGQPAAAMPACPAAGTRAGLLERPRRPFVPSRHLR